MQVADCYIHVPYRRLSRQEFEQLSERLLGVAVELARSVKRGRDMDYIFEEGTLFQRIVVIGGIGLAIYSGVAQYHNFRTSVIDMLHDAKSFSDYSVEKFHDLTHTTPADNIYKRTTSRDLNRLHRIVSSFDDMSQGHVPPSELAAIRRRLIHDLAGLARANPGDPEIAEVMRHLPKGPIPDLPDTPIEAIRMDEGELERGTSEGGEPRSPPRAIEEPRRAPRRRFHQRLAIRER